MTVDPGSTARTDQAFLRWEARLSEALETLVGLWDPHGRELGSSADAGATSEPDTAARAAAFERVRHLLGEASLAARIMAWERLGKRRLKVWRFEIVSDALHFALHADAWQSSATFLRQRLELFEQIARAWGPAPREDAPGAKRLARSLRRQVRPLASQYAEAGSAEAIDARFGPGTAAALGNLALVAIAAFIVVVALEWWVGHDRAALAVIVAAEVAIAGILLTEFALRWVHAPRKGVFFANNWLTRLLPALPFGVITLFHDGGVTPYTTLLRLLRPVLAVYRMYVFGSSLLDNLVRRHAHLLDRDISLLEEPGGRRDERDTSLPAHTLIERLANADRESVQRSLGRDFAASLERVRDLARLPPVRWLLDRDTRKALATSDDDLAVAELIFHSLGARLQRWHRGLLGVSDFALVLSKHQALIWLGKLLEKATRCAYGRLRMLTFVFFGITAVSFVLPFEGLRAFAVGLWSQSGIGLVTGGLVSVFGGVLVFGLWLQRRARSEQQRFLQLAQAQEASLPRLKRVEGFAAADRQSFDARVAWPEATLHSWPEPVRSGTGVIPGGRRADDCEAHAFELMDLLYEDVYLANPPLSIGGDRTSRQVLGNNAMRDLIVLLGEDIAHLERELGLNSDADGGPSGGFWFRVMSQSLALEAARLVHTFNTEALSLAERARLSPDDPRAERFARWLAGEPLEAEQARGYHATHFHLLHVYHADPSWEAEVARCVGADVLQAWHTARRDAIRRLFGSPRPPKVLQTFNPYHVYQDRLAGGRWILLPMWVVLGLLRVALSIGRWLLGALAEMLGLIAPRERMDVEAHFSAAQRKLHFKRKPVFLLLTRWRSRFDPEFHSVALPGAAECCVRNEGALSQDLAYVGVSRAEARRFSGDAARHASVHTEVTAFFASPAAGAAARAVGAARFADPEFRRAFTLAWGLDYCGLRRFGQACVQVRALVREAIGARGRRPGHSRVSEAVTGVAVGIERAVASAVGSNHHLALFEGWWQSQGMALAGVAPETPEATDAARALRRWWRTNTRGLAHVVAIAATVDGYDVEAHVAGLAQHISATTARWTEDLVALRALQTISLLDLQAEERLIQELGEFAKG